MAGGRITFGKPKRKTKPPFVLSGGPLLKEIKIKNECQYPILPDEYQERAAKAFSDGTLSKLDGQLRCKCGASVGATKSLTEGYFSPTRHEVYKEPRRVARKPSPRK